MSAASLLRRRVSTPLFLASSLILLLILWLPGLSYPIVSDTAIYGLLGRSVWEQGSFTLLGVPYAKHLPLHAILSYPLVPIFGFHVGMKVSSLLAGMGTLLAAYALMRKVFSIEVALLTVIAVLVHPAFVLMTMLGSADLLFTCLTLLSLFSYIRAEHDERWYIGNGIFTGLACLTRYNGIPLFLLFFLWTLWKRRTHMSSAWFWMGQVIGIFIFGIWLTRNALVFGNPLFTDYTKESEMNSPSLIRQFVSNVTYYLNPFHNLFPFLLPFAVIGLWRHGLSRTFLIAAMLALWAITSVWWVQAMRFAFPGYVLLFAFAAMAIVDVYRSLGVWRVPLMLLGALLFLLIQGGALCIYTYGRCNATFDRYIGVLPKNLHLTSEGLFALDRARQYINASIPEGSTIMVDDLLKEEVWKEGLFRSDLRIIGDPVRACPSYYRMTQNPVSKEEILFASDESPITYVTLQRCM